MDATLPPPPCAQLIRRLRTAPPEIPIRQAALIARALGYKMSPSTWEQIENGSRMERGARQPRGAPPRTVAVMAAVVGATPEELRGLGCDRAAGELEYLIRTGPFTKGQKQLLSRLAQPESEISKLTQPE